MILEHEAHEAPIKTEIFSIRTRDLSLWYGDFQALKGVTVNIKQGIVTSLIGPAGCGKTTLLRCFHRINERYGNVTTRGDVVVTFPYRSLMRLKHRSSVVF